MSRLFEIQDLSDNLPETFKLRSDSPANFKLLRLITGNVRITNLDTSVPTDINENYLSFYYNFDESIRYEDNICQILNESIDPEDLDNFFNNVRFKRKNENFFNRLENEFCNFLTYQEKGSYTTAFIFIYRILEVISFSFPLIYASKTYDFKHTYAELKNMFNSNNGKQNGELGFLKSAIKVMFDSSDLYETSIDFELSDELDKNEKLYKAVQSIWKENLFHEDTIPNSKISISFGDVSSFIVTIRNRFFHLLNRGDKNLESIEIIDPDYFFSKLNRPLFSWVCVIYIEINKFLLEEFEKYVK